MHSKSQQHAAADNAKQLGALLSLLAFVGSLSCPAGRNTNEGSSTASANGGVAQHDQHSNDVTGPERGVDQLDSSGADQRSGLPEQAQHSAANSTSHRSAELHSGSARLCQDLCLQVSIFAWTACTAIFPHMQYSADSDVLLSRAPPSHML